MKPEELSSSQSGLSLSQQSKTAGNNTQISENRSQQEAAAKVIRSKIDDLYESQTHTTSIDDRIAKASKLVIENPYERVHAEHTNPQANEWKKYHTAWQTYYQKYYEGYYDQKLAKSIKEPVGSASAEPAKTFSTDEAVFDLKQQILGKVQESATKIKKSRHFIPIAAGVFVVLIFAFLQYNRYIIANVAAYVSPGSINPQNIVIDPNADLAVPPEPKIIIPKINVDVPVMYDVGNDYSSQMAAMTKGLAQFAIPGASSHPGEVGNTVLAGHSSNDLFDTGDYKFIFAQLDKLEVGDTIYANYNSKRYTYTVTKKEVVKPSDVSKLVYATDKPILTLLTCTPVGTATNRLLVTAEQISPDPSKSNTTPVTNKTKTTSIPGNSPTFFEYLFGSK